MPDRRLDGIEERLTIAAEILRKQREQQKRLDLALDLAGVGMWDLDVDTKELIWDDRMCDLFGESKCAIKTYDIFVSKVVPEDRRKFKSAITRAMKGKTFDITYRIDPGDDCCKWIHARGLLHTNGVNKLIGVCLELDDRCEC